MRPRTLGAEKLREYLREHRIAAVDFARAINIRNAVQVYRYTGSSNTVPSNATKKAISKATDGFIDPLDWFRLYVGKKTKFYQEDE